MAEKKQERKPDDRVRNFATVVYPESAPEDWMETLAGEFVPAFVSPLHDKDINPGGEPKKPHYHVVLMFEGKKSMEQVREITAKIGGVGLEKVNSIRGYARYLCHLDNPEKAQYLPEDVRCLCGADYNYTIGLVTDKYKAIDEIMDFIDANSITSYRNLMQYCRKERRDWFRVLCDNGTYVVMEYLKSAEWTGPAMPICDPATGEVVSAVGEGEGAPPQATAGGTPHTAHAESEV